MKLATSLALLLVCGFVLLSSSAMATASEAESGELVEAFDMSALEATAETVASMEQDAALADAEAETEEVADTEADADSEAEGEEDAEAEAEAETETETETEESESESDAEAEADAEEEEVEEPRFRAESETEVDADAHLDATLEAMSAAELSAESGMEFEEESADEAVEDAEDEEATAEEHASANSPRFAERVKRVRYSESFAKDALAYAQAAYYTTDPQKCVRAVQGNNSFELIHTVSEKIFDGSMVHGFTAVDNAKERLIVAFHGDVAVPALAKRLWKGKPIKYKVLCKSCKTHKYYAHINGKVCPEMIASARLLSKQYPNYEVVLTGHGVGGALAATCGYQMEMSRAFRQTNRRRFVSFGQPRVGNCHFARKFNQIFPDAIRVTHGNDPVVHIAPCHADPVTQRCIEVKDRKKRLWAFHNPTQVWYPSTMPSTSTSAAKGEFTVCRGENWGEDEACRTRPLGFSMDDHRHYFGVDVANNCAKVLGTA